MRHPELRERLRVAPALPDADPAMTMNTPPAIGADDMPGPADRPLVAAAVLVAFVMGAKPGILLTRRTAHLNKHAGQVSFPGGRIDPDDATPEAAALREAQEEVGLDPASVEVLGTLPALWLPPSGFVVHPVVAWWRSPHPVRVVDVAEVAAVARVPLEELTDPANRLTVTHPSGWVGPAFEVRELLVWGFTAGLLDRLLALGGWERPWDASQHRPLDPQTVALALRGTSLDVAPPPTAQPAS